MSHDPMISLLLLRSSGIFPRIVEEDFFSRQGQYRVDSEVLVVYVLLDVCVCLCMCAQLYGIACVYCCRPLM